MAKPPPAGPSSDVEGNDKTFHAGTPPTQVTEQGAEARQHTEEESKGRPAQSAEKPGGR